MRPAEETAGPSPPRRDRYITEVGPNDVQLGRGRPIVTNEGNQRFRRLVVENKTEYTASSRHALKDVVARRILNIICERGGRFLRKIESATEKGLIAIAAGVQAWAVVDDETSLQKVKQALRELETTTKPDSAKGSDTSVARKKRKAPATSAKPTLDDALLLSASAERVAPAPITTQSLAAAAVASSFAVGATSRHQAPPGGQPDGQRQKKPPDTSADRSPPHQEDILFRLKHPTLRKRDMLRQRRLQQEEDRKVAALALGNAPATLSAMQSTEEPVGASVPVMSSSGSTAGRAPDAFGDSKTAAWSGPSSESATLDRASGSDDDRKIAAKADKSKQKKPTP